MPWLGSNTGGSGGGGGTSDVTKTYVDTELAKKIDKTIYNADISKKADISYVDNKLVILNTAVEGLETSVADVAQAVEEVKPSFDVDDNSFKGPIVLGNDIANLKEDGVIFIVK